jgi:hypothetical protein
MTARSVMVSLPFGGEDDAEQRRAILNFKRLEYLISKKCGAHGSSMEGSDQIVYAVNVADTATGAISEVVMEKILAADILVALVQEPNANVTCEVRARRDYSLPVILVGNWPGVPVYEKDYPRLAWEQPSINAVVEMIVNNPADYPLNGFDGGIPNALQDAIDKHDDKLRKQLDDALGEVESLFPKPPKALECIRRILSDDIINFYPCSIIEIPIIAPGQSKDKPATVIDFDVLFSNLYGFSGKTGATVKGKSLTLDYLMQRLQNFVDPPDWQEFLSDQQRLTEIILNAGYAKAEVPLRINQSHPRDEFKGKHLLPSVVAQIIDESPDGSQTVYLLVEYVTIPRLN